MPECIRKAVTDNLDMMSHYPGTSGTAALREAIARWCVLRYGAQLDASTQILPVLGSREALFSFTQSHINASGAQKSVALIPCPFYQIYEGASLLAGAEPVYMPLSARNGFLPDFSCVPESVLARTQVVFVCSPGNPTGSVMKLENWKELFELSDQYGFAIVSDECYSEIYFEEGQAPLGALSAAKLLGRDDFKNIIIMQSLSKRSNAPGMRSGFVAGDAALIKPFLLYRTYHGSAMNPTVQAASIAAWSDEAHVVENRRLYREKFAAAQPVVNSALEAPMPEASFYLWTKVPGDDTIFARELYRKMGVRVLPGSYLSRDLKEGNPGTGYVRIAFVAEPSEALEAAERIAEFVKTR